MASMTASDQFGEYARQQARVDVLRADDGLGAVVQVVGEDGTRLRLELDRMSGLSLADDVSRECGV